jgi:hypothetical protein
MGKTAFADECSVAQALVHVGAAFTATCGQLQLGAKVRPELGNPLLYPPELRGQKVALQ